MQNTKFAAVLSTFILCMFTWMLLTWSVSVQELAAGAVVSLGAALFSARYFIHGKAFRFFNPVKFFTLIVFGVSFLKELILSNISMVKRVFGGCRVNPGIVKIPTDQKSDYGLALLADSISLTPGTITMDVAEEDGRNYYYIHWIDMTAEGEEAAGDAIKANLEKAVRRVFD